MAWILTALQIVNITAQISAWVVSALVIFVVLFAIFLVRNLLRAALGGDRER